MSIQDDIFDVEHALEGKPESKSFNRIYTYLGQLERELKDYKDFYKSAVDLKIAIDKLSKKSK